MGGAGEVPAPVESCSLDRAGTVEQRFGVLGCTVSGGTRWCGLLTGDHAVTDDEGVAGVLAVLGDHVLGEVANHPQPPGLLPVTTALTLDVLRQPPWPTDRLAAQARQSGAGGEYARAEIGIPGGPAVALAAAWMAHVPARGVPPLSTVPPVGARVPAPPVADLLDVQFEPVGVGRARGRLEAEDWTNQNGTLHGGVAACAAVSVAERLLGGHQHGYRTSHLDVAYLRPLGPVGVEFQAVLLHRGRRSGAVQVQACDGEGRAALAVTVMARSRSGG